MSDHATPDDLPEPPRELWSCLYTPGTLESIGVGCVYSSAARVRERIDEAAMLIGVHPAYRHHLRALLSAAQAVLSGSGQEDAARRRLREAARAAGEFDDNGGAGP